MPGRNCAYRSEDCDGNLREQPKLRIGNAVRNLIIPDHALERGAQRICQSPDYCCLLILQSLTAISEAAPEIFTAPDFHTLDIIDYYFHIFVGLHISESGIRVQTIGRQGQFWPRPGNTVLCRKVVHHKTIVECVVWQQNDTP